MRKFFLLLFCAVSVVPVLRAQMPDPDSVSVAMATVFGDIVRRNLESVRAGGAEFNDSIFAERLVLALRGKYTGMDMDRANAVMQSVLDNSTAANMAPAAEQKALIDKAKATEGAVVLPSGTVFIVITEGEGKKPGEHDVATVDYIGRLADGRVFDSTTEPFDMPVDGVITGFSEGLREMLPGGTYRLVIPSSAAYGDKGVPGAIPGGSALDFTVTLIGSRPANGQ